MNTQELLSPAAQRLRTYAPSLTGWWLALTTSGSVVSFPASQYLQASAALNVGAVSTSLPQLDEAISPPSPEEDGTMNSRGIRRGQVTEVFGPPGVGKTSLALSIAANALRAGGKVVWIDTGSPLPRLRLRDILQGRIESSKNLTHIRAQSLPHLLALLLHCPSGFPPEDCSLLVIDSASGPFASYFPNPTELKTRLAQSKPVDKAQVQWLMNRNANITSDLANQLIKLATTHHMAVLAINQTRTRIKGQPRATLCPVLAGGAWESSISTRLVLYRDFPATETTSGETTSGSVRFAEVMKRSGRMLAVRAAENIIPFVVETNGLRALDDHPSPGTIAQDLDKAPETSLQRKRKVDEIADSEDEADSDADYGWVDDDGLEE
ncbi:uncharacterized protein DSM5745_04026 [Aspergillus mulundensis]|uniref:DNA repair protein RAD51 homolog 3 n=1 Tax=Aspergillus mulundensis TaxID=1810919 RepID=A0A3D8SBL0_9EURO|nr:Uncharacterized protein DSM5745_04026 [Aspergillus mulundensis]RDW83700.1 Uncharacterized protein DSM5745_04026 [Aspergillus mulundensis]